MEDSSPPGKVKIFVSIVRNILFLWLGSFWDISSRELSSEGQWDRGL
jgi:hypothetical protein